MHRRGWSPGLLRRGQREPEVTPAVCPTKALIRAKEILYLSFSDKALVGWCRKHSSDAFLR